MSASDGWPPAGRPDVVRRNFWEPKNPPRVVVTGLREPETAGNNVGSVVGERKIGGNSVWKNFVRPDKRANVVGGIVTGGFFLDAVCGQPTGWLNSLMA